MNIQSFIKQQYLPLYLLMAILLVYRLLICFSYTPELSFGEANNIWNALNVANGKSMYFNPVDTPFEIFQYTPLSQLPTILSAYLFDSKVSAAVLDNFHMRTVLYQVVKPFASTSIIIQEIIHGRIVSQVTNRKVDIAGFYN